MILIMHSEITASTYQAWYGVQPPAVALSVGKPPSWPGWYQAVSGQSTWQGTGPATSLATVWLRHASRPLAVYSTCSLTVQHCLMWEWECGPWSLTRLYSIQYPALFQFLLELEKSSPELQMQFFLDPTAIPAILEVWELFGQQAVDHVYYLARTYMSITSTGKSKFYWAFGGLIILKLNQRKLKSKNVM